MFAPFIFDYDNRTIFQLVDMVNPVFSGLVLIDFLANPDLLDFPAYSVQAQRQVNQSTLDSTLKNAELTPEQRQLMEEVFQRTMFSYRQGQLDQIRAGFGDGVDYNDIADRLLIGAGGSPADEYLLLADFDSYCQAHRRAIETYADRKLWNQMSLINIARSGIFAADRSIRDYASDIWHVPTRL